MGSTTNQVGTLLPIMTQSTAATNVSSVAESNKGMSKASASFDNILNQFSDTVMQTRANDAGKDNKALLNDADQKNISDDATRKTEKENGSPSDKDIKKFSEACNNADNAEKANATGLKETDSTEADKKLQEAIEEDGKKLVSEIAEAFDVSEDEILGMMQAMGLMMADLLDPQNLQELVTRVIGQDKALELLTDSDLYTSLQDLLEGAEDMRSQLMNEFDLSDEELQNVINGVKADFTEHLSKETEKMPEVIINEAGDELFKDKTALQSDKTSAERPEVTIERSIAEENRPVETSERSQNDSNKGSFHQEAGAPNLFNQVLNNITEAAMNESAQEMQYTDRAQMADIIRQITERITISSGQDETTMELQLHPASLGNVNIMLTSSKDGIVAKFTAQNEIVKEAVESQMIQLQQKFEAQGIKVTSIEVTIASHEFERNLDEQNKRQGSDEETGKGKKNTRRIDLSSISDLEDEALDDSDKITAQMMAANGNTVDYTA